MNLDIDCLRSFLVVADAMSFSRAAETVGRSQSTVSQQIAKLETQAIAAHIATKDGLANKFLTVDELKRLPGASEELIGAMEPFVSVYNFRAEPDFGLAPDRLKALITEGQGRVDSDVLARPAGASSNRAGIYTITASLLDGEAGASVRSIVYVTGDKREPYYVFDWRRVAGRKSAACGEVQAQ